MKIRKQYDRVKNLLEQKKEYRDDYLKLLVRVWWEELDQAEQSSLDFLNRFREGKHSHPVVGH